ncbi:DLIC-domain-containing protein [Testicularia cyperi]|uniref:DLIC-domain-containing protein n=1 Tax=Testicularia cyperi TaxID=1882483 RepID=A0A317XIT9_9BASI|nr:DLIC-domain-containing protein [Testicularia cyperi]
MDVVSSPVRPQMSSALSATPIKPPSSHDGAIPSSSSNQASQPNGDSQPQDLWSSILDSVKSSKAITTKNLVVLGEPKTGKTTLVNSLASRSPAGLIKGTASLSRVAATGLDQDANTSSRSASAPANELGLAYGYFDVGDEKDRDEIVARVGVYTLHSSQPAYTSLLPFAFPPSNTNLKEEQASASMSSLTSVILSSSSSSAAGSPASQKHSNRFLSAASVDSLQESLVVIVLDWEQPWTFLEQLRNWLIILHDLLDRASDNGLTQRGRDQKWSQTRVALDEMRERLEKFVRSYVEPHAGADVAAGGSNAAASGVATAQTTHESTNAGSTGPASKLDDTVMPATITNISVQLEGDEAPPLTDGMLTDNWGIPLVVVCAKSDAIPRLERDKNFKEEQFDYIQQVLRTICMKYGAGLFYSSSTKAQSIDILRSYILHRLFTQGTVTVPAAGSVAAAAPSSSNAGQANGSAAAGGTTAFPFAYRASTTDRDTLLVPAGWDSWGKIRALRESFDCKGLGRGWELDCELDALRRSRKLPRTKEVEDQLEKEVLSDRRSSGTGAGGEDVQSAIKLYEDIVSDWEAGPTSKDSANKVKIPDEQAFLGLHHATLQKDPDPRSKFSKSGVVGPMSASSRGLPSVEKFMSRADGSGSTTGVGIDSVSSGGGGVGEEASASTWTPSSRSGAAASRGDSTPANNSKREYTSSSASAAAAAAAAAIAAGDRNSRPSSPAISPGATSPSGGAPKQSEVLHSFFQSLLKDKGSSVGSPKHHTERLARSTASSNPARRETRDNPPPPSSSS